MDTDRPIQPLRESLDHYRDLEEDPSAPATDSHDGADSSKGTPPKSLDELPHIERKYGMDAQSEPNQEDIDHLCNVWAAVGRAILMRRRAAR